jgi:TRAP transporter TAXI family solute receptor
LAAGLCTPAASAFATTAPQPGWPSAVWMGTGRPGGVYDIYGAAWGKIAQANSGVSIAYRASGGAASDILLIEQGAAQLGMTTVAVADQARSGSAAWTAGVRFGAFRALFPMFPSILQIVTTRASGVTSVAGLAGRAIGVGPDGGSATAAVPGILASIGVVPAHFMTGDFTAQMQDLLAGRLAACAFITAPPLQAIAQVAAREQLGLIGFTPDEALQVSRANSGMSSMVIPAGTFARQQMPIASVGTANFAIGAAGLPASLITAITLAAFNNRNVLAQAVPAAQLFNQTALITPGQMPFHQGAAAALRKIGLDVPDRMVQG